ncbi:hypothetical protein GQ55_9G187600 [Panicum hallii var. hallii]|uniref:Uncharacterized protein n=1 Tax=Panicum hallii var. hallii TaxID=1504633 RepID=A0A2T7C4R6_9POAL|nr:hypothetical protein GQ55_9G187600 [Panicum hallii var. hallii]
MNLPKKELTRILCDYIMSIDDAIILERLWVRSFHPYNITLTIKDLQETLRIDKGISKQRFNLRVRYYVAREYRKSNDYNRAMSKHLMDLRFYTMCDLTRDPKFCKKL